MSTALRRALPDTWTLTRRTFAHWARQPAPVLVGLLFPVLMVLMFGYLFGGGMDVPGRGDYREFLMPGMFAMTMVFGIESTFTAVAGDTARGVTDRFRSMPMSHFAVLGGRVLADMLHAAVGLLVLICCGLAVGWRWHEGPARAALAVAMLLLLRLAVLWLGIYLALRAKGPESVAILQILVWPLGFLSNVFVSPDTMPGWLGVIAEWNPLSASAGAGRELFGNPGWAGGSWVVDHPILMAFGWPLVLIAIFAPLSVRHYRGLGR